VKRLLLVGGGHAHVEVLRAFAEAPVPEWETILVSSFPRQLYSGMIPGHIAGHYTLDECAIDLAPLAHRAGAAFQRNVASIIDPGRREVLFADGTSLRYDLLSLNIGARSFAGTVPGAERHAIPIRPFENAVDAWRKVLERASAGEIQSITLVGGGAAGVEVALAMRHALVSRLHDAAPHVRVVTDAPRPLPEFPASARQRLARWLSKRGIGMHAGNAVKEVAERRVRLEGGLEFVSDATFWTGGAAAPELLRDSGFAVDAKGYLLTDDFLRSKSHPGVFAVGDCATQEGRERPRAGVFAVRAAPALAANLRAAMTDQPLKPHLTGKRYLALVSTGPRHAVGMWDGISWEGGWVWRWKDRIDRRFVARYAA
jgi:selenide,water dikinase